VVKIQPNSTVNSAQSEANTFNYSKFSPGMIFLCLTTQVILPHVFKMSAFVNTCCEWCTPWSVEASIVRCSKHVHVLNV